MEEDNVIPHVDLGLTHNATHARPYLTGCGRTYTRNMLGRIAKFGMMALVAGSGLCSAVGCRQQPADRLPDAPLDRTREDAAVPASPAELSESFHKAARRVLPAVVQIVSWDGSPNDEWSPGGSAGGADAMDDGDGTGQPTPLLGSGVIVDAAGTVLTNHHVVEAADSLGVRTADGRYWSVRSVASDARSDLAVLQLDLASRESLPFAQLGDSRHLRIGDWVLTIGSPLDLGPTVSAGIISAPPRIPEGAGQVPLLQTDAAINPGSSGGALVNLTGELVGITTAIASRDGGFQGIGFAIPADTVQWVADQLLEHGVVSWAEIGVRAAARPAFMSPAGALLMHVDPRAAGHAGGLRVRDIVVAINGQTIEDHVAFQQTMERQPVGVACQLDVIREGVQLTCEVVPQELAATAAAAATEPRTGPDAHQGEPGQVVYSVELELAVADLAATSNDDSEPHPPRGVRIVRVDPGGPADQAGLQSGMIVVRVGEQAIEDADDFAEILERESIASGIVLDVWNAGGTRTLRVVAP